MLVPNPLSVFEWKVCCVRELGFVEMSGRITDTLINKVTKVFKQCNYAMINIYNPFGVLMWWRLRYIGIYAVHVIFLAPVSSHDACRTDKCFLIHLPTY